MIESKMTRSWEHLGDENLGWSFDEEIVEYDNDIVENLADSDDTENADENVDYERDEESEDDMKWDDDDDDDDEKDDE